MAKKQTLSSFKITLAVLMQRRFGLTLNDWFGSDADIEKCIMDGESPADVCDRLEIKYDLDRLDQK